MPSDDSEQRVLGMPARCALAVGFVLGATCIGGVVGISHLKNQQKLALRKGACDADVMSHDSPEQIAQLRGVLHAVPKAIERMTRSLVRDGQTTPDVLQERASKVHEEAKSLLRVTLDAKKAFLCSDVSPNELSKLDVHRRALWRLYGRAHRLTPAGAAGARRGRAKALAAARNATRAARPSLLPRSERRSAARP